LPANVRDGVLFASPRSDDERSAVAVACVRKLNIDIPALLDGIDDQTEHAYTAWPDRMYVIDTQGRVAYRSDPGPFGFSTRELEQALRRITMQ
jgi:type I thyroxine 5'-deiodinase